MAVTADAKIRVNYDGKNAERGLSKLKGTVKSLAAGFGGLFVINKVNDFLRESAELAKVQIQAEAQLTAALGRRSDALIRNAAALQKQTTFGDEAIIKAQALVAAFVKEESTINRLTPAILDLAAAKGMDLSAAADLVTKTVASSTNALSRYGIQVEGAAGSTERADSAVQAITKAFGGMAQALADTDVGKLQQMENELNDIKESIGNEVIPAQLAWNKLVLDTVKGIGVLIDGFKQLTGLARDFNQEQEDATRARIVGLQQQQIEVQKIIDLQKEAKLEFEAGKISVKGGIYDPEVLADAEKRLKLIKSTIEENRKALKADTTASAIASPVAAGGKEAAKAVTGLDIQDPKFILEQRRQVALELETMELESQQRRLEKITEFQDELSRITDEREEMDLERKKERFQKEEAMRKAAAQAALSAVGSVSNAIVSIRDNQFKREDALAIAAVQNSEKSEKEKEAAILAIQKEAFERDKKRQIAQVFMAGALGAARLWASPGFPMAIPLTVALGVANVAQAAIIASQKFQTGGLIGGELNRFRSADNVPISAGRGEFIVNSTATARNIELLEQINSGVTDLGGTGGTTVMNFNGLGREQVRDVIREDKRRGRTGVLI